jgi:hypothetical protein
VRSPLLSCERGIYPWLHVTEEAVFWSITGQWKLRLKTLDCSRNSPSNNSGYGVYLIADHGIIVSEVTKLKDYVADNWQSSISKQHVISLGLLTSLESPAHRLVDIHFHTPCAFIEVPIANVSSIRYVNNEIVLMYGQHFVGIYMIIYLYINKLQFIYVCAFVTGTWRIGLYKE